MKSMIGKSGNRFSKKIMLHQKPSAATPALAQILRKRRLGAIAINAMAGAR